MKKTLIILSFVLGMFYMYSCEVDNYDAPDMTLQGNIVDKVTNQNIQTRQPDGIRMRLIEVGYPTPLDFWAKPDGSFANTKLFAAKYKLLAMEGIEDDPKRLSKEMANQPANYAYWATARKKAQDKMESLETKYQFWESSKMPLVLKKLQEEGLKTPTQKAIDGKLLLTVPLVRGCAMIKIHTRE